MKQQIQVQAYNVKNTELHFCAFYSIMAETLTEFLSMLMNNIHDLNSRPTLSIFKIKSEIIRFLTDRK